MKKKRLLILCFMSLFLLLGNICEAKEQEEDVVSCKNLGKVTDIDNLLYQFYSNIDSQCLFEIPTKKLEEVWGIQVLDYIGVTPEKKDRLNMEYQKIVKDGNGFFVTKKDYQRGIAAFYIDLTNNYLTKYKDTWGGSLSKWQFPKLLPPPQAITYLTPNPLNPQVSEYFNENLIPKDNAYKKYTWYYWINKGQSNEQPILLLETGIIPIPGSIVLYSKAQFLDYITRDIK